MPCEAVFYKEPPRFRNLETLALLPFPSGRAYAEAIPRTVPFIGCGAPSFISEAFRCGASDYLCDPWTEDELNARLRRMLLRSELHFMGADAVLRGTRLTGPKGTISLSSEEAALLRMLERQDAAAVSRVALRRILWPRLSDQSRIVDETVSRLRRSLIETGISKSCIHIRSVRGFGYRIEIAK